VSKATDKKFAEILDKAFAAGIAAAAATVPVPMIVNQHAGFDAASPVTKSYVVEGGCCGFGWVSFAGNTAFGRWAKKTGHAKSGYLTGLQIWSPLMTQSMTRNEAWAYKVAEVLRENGIDAHGRSRMD